MGMGVGRLTQRPQHSAHHRRPAVHVQLHAVLPGEALGSCRAQGTPSIPQGHGGERETPSPRLHGVGATGQHLMLEHRWSCLRSAVPGEPRGAAASWDDGQTPTWHPELALIPLTPHQTSLGTEIHPHGHPNPHQTLDPPDGHPDTPPFGYPTAPSRAQEDPTAYPDPDNTEPSTAPPH